MPAECPTACVCAAHARVEQKHRRFERPEVKQGTIKKLTDRGFGFIEGERGDIFFHSSSLKDIEFEQLREGQRVEYNEGRGPKGPSAQDVRVVS